MIMRRLRRQNGINAFIVFTDMLFVLVFILLLQVLSQGLAARSEALASIQRQQQALGDARESLRTHGAAYFNAVNLYQHESLQRICFSHAMTFRKGSADITQLPTDISSGELTVKNRKFLLYAFAKQLKTALPTNSSLYIEGFSGPGESERIAFDRAYAVMRVVQSAGFPGYRLKASAFGGLVPRTYGYDVSAPNLSDACSYDRRVEILVISRKTE
jgi:hypothetical protein